LNSATASGQVADVILIADIRTPQAFIEMVTDHDLRKVHELPSGSLGHGD